MEIIDEIISYRIHGILYNIYIDTLFLSVRRNPPYVARFIFNNPKPFIWIIT